MELSVTVPKEAAFLVYFYGEAPNWSFILLGRLVESILREASSIQTNEHISALFMNWTPRHK